MLVDFLIKYRGVFIALFVLPISLVFKVYMSIRNKLVFWLNSAPDKHSQKVAKIQEQVKAWKQVTGGNIPMCTARPGWQAMSLKQGNYKKTHYQVKINLQDILEIDSSLGAFLGFVFKDLYFDIFHRLGRLRKQFELNNDIIT